MMLMPAHCGFERKCQHPTTVSARYDDDGDEKTIPSIKTTSAENKEEEEGATVNWVNRPQ